MNLQTTSLNKNTETKQRNCTAKNVWLAPETKKLQSIKHNEFVAIKQW